MPDDRRNVRLKLSMAWINRWRLSTLLVAAWLAALSTDSLSGSVLSLRRAYDLGTLLLAGVGATLPLSWPRDGQPTEAARHSRVWPALAGTGTLVLMFVVATRSLPVVFAGAPDVMHGDMLVIIQQAVARFLSGRNPYFTYFVPWKAPLAYGPGLWFPYVTTHFVRADPRVLTLVCQLFVLAVCGAGVTVLAARRDLTSGMLLGLLTVGIGLDPKIAGFFPIGHTQVYWPLIFLFCAALHSGHVRAAAVLLAALVLARTTIVVMVPVFFIHLFVRRSRPLVASLWFATTLAAGMLPFVVADPMAVWNGMYLDYLERVKSFVWSQTNWAHLTYGATAWLLSCGFQRYLELLQICLLGSTYVAAWVVVKKGWPVEPWMGVALIVFSMTTIWPVYYIYFDVVVFLTAALVACVLPRLRAKRHWLVATFVPAAVAAVILLSAASRQPGSRYTIDVGTPAANGFTGAGFGRDIAEREGDRTFVWVDGERATIRLPRAGLGGVSIRVVLRPYPKPGLRQMVEAVLNGHRLGVAAVGSGWQDLVFQAPWHVWNYGFNVLELRMPWAAAQLPGGRESDRGRSPSVAVDKIIVE